MTKPKFPSPAERNAFRRHIEDYMRRNGYGAAALYLLLHMAQPATFSRGMLEACHRMNIGQLNALSLCEPFCIFDDQAHIFLSAAVPEKLLCFDLACEMAELLDVEPDLTLKDGEYWHDEMITKDLPSRAFALELCLPTPKMACFRSLGYDAEQIAEYVGIHVSVVLERLGQEDVPEDVVETARRDYETRTGRRTLVRYDSPVWTRREGDPLFGC